MVVHSFTSDKMYDTTPESCSCPAKYWHPGKQCKHQVELIHQINRAQMFLLLMARFDVRSQAVIEEKRAAYWNFEMAIAC